MAIIKFVDDNKDHIPPIMTAELHPFPFHIVVNPLSSPPVRSNSPYSLAQLSVMDYLHNENPSNTQNNNNNKNEFGPEFIRALNKIPVVFYDSKNVMESYQNFLTKIDDHTRSEYLNENSKSPNQLLYDLAISMYDDLKMSKPDYKTFFTYLNV